MKKQKMNKTIIFTFYFLAGLTFASNGVQANGSATLWWIAPTTDEDGGVLGGGINDLVGYKIFYSTSAMDCTDWDAGDQTYRLVNPIVATSTTVTESAAMRNASDLAKRGYTFNGANLLTVGQSYNFAVVAYDSSGNLSKCATTPQAATVATKDTISYASDINKTGASLNKVDIQDYNILFTNFGNATCGNSADITGPNSSGACVVNIFDYSIMFADFGKSF